MATKLNIENLMPGGGAWWHNQTNPMMPTRARGGGYPQIGISESELEDFQSQRQEPNQSIKNFNEYGEKAKAQAQKIAEQRTGGMLPEQNTNPIVDRHQRRSITDKDARTRGVGFAPVTEWSDDDEGVAAIGGKPARANTSQVRTDNGETKQASTIQQGGGSAIDSNDTEHAVSTPADRHQRGQVDETKANPDEVNALQEELGLTDGGTATAHGTNPATPSYNSYDDILKLMRHDAISDAELARRQRSREIVTGLGDTISAIANMWATTKGAPNSYDNSKGMSATAQERYARMLAERKAQQDQILNYYRVKRQAEQEKENQEYRSAVAQSRKDQLEEQQRHNKELEKIAAGKAEVDKENKERAAAEKERSNKANEEERNRHNQAVENKKSQGKTGGSSKNKKGKTHTGKKGKVYGRGKGKKRLY